MKELAVIKGKGKNSKDLIIYFFIYAFIGWILETTYAFLVHKHFVNRGFLFGPLCPIYGFGAVLLILSLNSSKGNPIKEFFVAAVAFTIFEYMASYVLEVLFGLRWWDYTNDFMNLQGRVSISYSVIWGAMGIILIEGIHPFINKKLSSINNKLSYRIQDIILITVVVLLIVDFGIAVTKYINI